VSAEDTPHCKQVGGAILTNFIDPTTTLGTATGDLRGGLGVSVLNVKAGTKWISGLSQSPPMGNRVWRHDFFADADARAYPTPAGIFGTAYTNGVQITGGTGRFAGATGKLAIYGAVDLPQGQIILRYSGQVCFKSVPTP